MDRFEMTPRAEFETPLAIGAERVTAFLRKVYGWMFAGLGITAAVAFVVAGSPNLIRTILGNPILFIAMIVAELGLVVALSARVDRMAARTAAILFVTYSALNGVLFSAILLTFTGASIATTFLVTAGMFGALALYGTATRRSLAGVGQFVFMGLIGLVIAMVVGVFVFTGLTAWDAQRLKAMAAVTPDDRIAGRSIVGALALYLDFVNLFLFMLRFLGARRD